MTAIERKDAILFIMGPSKTWDGQLGTAFIHRASIIYPVSMVQIQFVTEQLHALRYNVSMKNELQILLQKSRLWSGYTVFRFAHRATQATHPLMKTLHLLSDY